MRFAAGWRLQYELSCVDGLTQAELNRRKGYVAAGAAAVAARPSITIDTRQEWAGGADGNGNSAHSPGDAAAAAAGTPRSTSSSGVRGGSPRGGSPHTSDGFQPAPVGIASGSGIRPIAISGGGDDSSDSLAGDHSMAGDSSSSFGTCGVAESASATGHSPRTLSWPAGQGASPRDGYSRRQPAQWTLPPTVSTFTPVNCCLCQLSHPRPRVSASVAVRRSHQRPCAMYWNRCVHDFCRAPCCPQWCSHDQRQTVWSCHVSAPATSL
jgi:hypothetical protein